MPDHSINAATDGSSDSTQTPELSGSGTAIHRWERVGSAVLGGALLALGLRRRSLDGTAMVLVGGWLSCRAIGGQSYLSQALGSDAADGRDRHESEVSADSPTVELSVIVGKSADELSEFVRDPENLGRIVGHFADVTSAGEGCHRWSVRGPLDRSLAWETRIVEDQPGEHVRWESTDGMALFDEWSVYFRPAPGDRGTEVTFRVRFDPPGGALGRAGMERLDVVPETLVRRALHRFKSLAETGKISTLDGNPSARGEGDLV